MKKQLSAQALFQCREMTIFAPRLLIIQSIGCISSDHWYNLSRRLPENCNVPLPAISLLIYGRCDRLRITFHSR
ncbi:MAG: hypothetical protein WAN92_01775, partial [Herbaspirillum sp.]